MKKLTVMFQSKIQDPKRSGLDWEGDTQYIWADGVVWSEMFFNDNTPNQTILDFLETLDASQFIWVQKWYIEPSTQTE